MADLFPAAVYILCLMTSGACAFLLARNYRRTGARLLFWSACCFALLALNNLIVIFDVLLFPATDFRAARALSSLAAVSVLLFGFVRDNGE